MITGIYLAAGAGSRMGGGKLSLELGASGRLGAYALEEALGSSLDHTIVVTREEGPPDWLPDSYWAAERSGAASRVCSPEAAGGLSHSLRAGLAAARSRGPLQAVVVMLADQPLLSRVMLERLLSAYRRNGSLDFCAAGMNGHPRPPVLLSRSMFAAVGRLKGDVGARELFAVPHCSGMVLEEVELHRFLDADTPQDLERIRTFMHGRAEDTAVRLLQ